MAILQRRSRLLTVRLSGEEHERLKRLCAEEEARSLSDFARDAILQRVNASRAPKASLTGDLNALGARLEQVDAAIKSLSECIERVLGKNSP